MSNSCRPCLSNAEGLAKISMDRNFTHEFRNSTLHVDDSLSQCLPKQRHLEQNKHHAMAIAVFNVPLCLMALVGNLAIFLAISKTRSLHSPANILLANLAVADFGVGLIAQPAMIIFLLTGMQGFSSTFYVMCTLEIASNYLCGVSTVTVTAIGLERLLALKLHLRYTSIITNFRAILAVIGVWLSVAIYSLAWLWKSQIFEITGSAIAVLLVTNFFIYSNICLIVRRHQRQIRHQQPQANVGNIFSSIIRLKRTVVNTFLVFILMSCCTAPQMLVLINRRPSLTAYYVTSTMINLNSSLNPVLYCWRIRELRSAVKKLFCR